MPFGPHKISDIDQAWEDLLGGHTLTSTAPVAFFQEEPHVDETTERVYPSISIQLIGIVPDDPRREGAPPEVKVGENTAPAVPLSQMQKRPQPYRLVYAVDTWAKGRARDDRELQQHILEKLGERGVLTNPDSGDLHNTFKAGWSNVDEADGDVRIYHKSYTYEVEVCIGPDAIREAEQATELAFTMNLSPGTEGAVIDDPDLTQCLTFTVTG